jgi:hypothetical protein
MAIPVEWAAQTLAVPPRRAIVAATFLLIGMSLALLSALFAEEKPRERAPLLASAFVALALVSLPDFAQREHLSLVGAIPYLVLAARRADGRATAWPIAAVTGLLAALAFALKHYFVMVPALLELWLLYRQRDAWRPLRPEAIVLLVAAGCYAAAVAAFSPEFLTAIVPRIGTAYDGYEVAFVDQLANYWLVLWVLAALVLWQQRHVASSLTVAAAIAAVAFGCAYFAQQKGWRYHALPATGAMFFALATLLPRQVWTGARWVRRTCLAGAMVVAIVPTLLLGPYANGRAPHVRELLRDSSPGDTIVMLTGNPSNIWPAVEEGNFRWPSRHFAFWMVYAMHAHRSEHGALTPALGDLADAVRRETVHDLLCNPPDLILVDDFRASKAPGFDILRFFEESDDFRRLFSHYARVRTVAIYTSYAKQEDWRPQPPPRCRTIH